jgi:endoglucanase
MKSSTMNRTLVLLALAGATCVLPPKAKTIPASGVAGSPCQSVTSTRKKGENPFAGACFMVEPISNARRQAEAWRRSRPADAAAMDKIASQPSAAWFGDWNGRIDYDLAIYVGRHRRSDALPVFVLYNVPNRDCGQYSRGGATGPERYKAWIDRAKKGIGSMRAVVVLEPDALGLMDRCLAPRDQRARLDMICYAVHALESTPGAAVYIDAGHDAWLPAADMADRLQKACIADATGFALNTSNYRATEDLIRYGHEISARVGGKHFIIDTARNGNGPPQGATGEAAWCNPDGRALGTPPTANTGDPLVDAFFWVKPPGESDGTCNHGPRAGAWWPEHALGLAKRAQW